MNIRTSLVPFASSLLALSLITACSNDGHSSGNDDPQQPQNQEHKLRKVGSATELEAYLKAGLKTASEGNGTIDNLQVPVDAPPAMPDDNASGGEGAGEGASFSNTTLIEDGVDEADVVKSDGELVFIAVPANNGCYELCEPVFALPDDGGDGIAVGEPNPNGVRNQIRIMQLDDASHSASEINRIDIPDSAEYSFQFVAGLMLTDDSKELVSVTNASSDIYHTMAGTADIVPADWSSIWAWSYGGTIIDTFSIPSATTISHQDRIEIDGYLLETRRIDNTLYVVTRYTPQVTLSGTMEARNAEIDALTLSQLLPQVSINGNKSTLVDPNQCFVDGDATGYPTLMVVTAIDLADNSFQSSCVTANMYSFYMSKKAIYLTQAEWSGENNENTHIYKFSLTEAGPAYRGEGSADGAPTANYNFSISEQDDVLRLVTTTWKATGPLNQLHTFAEDTSGNLQKLATLPNEQRPESIGKAGETVQGVRFVGDRAYVVTFLQTDPLYVVDLSNPADPFVAGQVEIPGFSTLLQPLGNDLLLGVGREDNNFLKVELYDVEDPSSPQSIGKHVVTGGYSESQAIWNHHALALLPMANAVRVGLPFYKYNYDSGYSASQGALSFSVDTLNRSLTKVAEADATSDDYFYGEQRVLLQSNTLHYIQGSKIWSSIWGSSEPMANPQ
jgi:uncharacterized secreted protein with C-terminal beta-propeller domain